MSTNDPEPAPDRGALPFRNAAFDCLVALWMLYHLPDIDRGLREVVRVLRPAPVARRLLADIQRIAPSHLRELRLRRRAIVIGCPLRGTFALQFLGRRN